MVDAGLSVNQEVIDAFTTLKMNKSHRYVTFKLSDDYKQIIVDNRGEISATYADFLKTLPPNQPRFAVFDYHHEYEDGRK